ncbi:saccharopine dehydrogenase NADP-binding domain-containing protein [Nocardia puris]|uniref:Short subunit dehydrogenase-like uncharacterized protein n=1 Tax=Nocardia puris TaxID=208602 RepID=A0A366E5V6_9NOCA|nr:saccharopine dehydrogenase NADP-binding domain-containing protein [Nocardia puris]RBO96788.1 short subunit dehydrogenase-like uncharacterized protein [Nocardia puris]
MSKIVVAGANGYTGRLVAAELRTRGVSVQLAVRRPEAGQSLLTDLGHPPMFTTTTFEAHRGSSPVPGLAAGDVVINCIGPYALTGPGIIDSAIRGKAHYLDAAGESGFLREVFAGSHAAARAAGTVVAPGFGFESVPGHLAAARAVQAAGDSATGVEIFYSCDPRAASHGTVNSAVRATQEPAHRLTGGVLLSEELGARRRVWPIAGRRYHGVSIGTTEALALPRAFPRLREVSSYLGAPGGLGRVFSATARAGVSAARNELGRRLIDTLEERTRHRPASRSTRPARTVVAARASNSEGRPLQEVRFAGADPYALTAHLLACAGVALLSRPQLPSGVLGPLEVFDANELEGLLAQRRMCRLPCSVDDLAEPVLTHASRL